MSLITDVGDNFRHALGNFYCAVRSDFETGIDVLACTRRWSGRYNLGEEDYGRDEPYLPAFHAVKVVSNIREGWTDFFEISNAIDGPLTISLVGINVFGAEEKWHAANSFKRKMQRLRFEYAVSTAEISGILFERVEPFQILVASKVLRRPAIINCAADRDHA